MHHAVGAGIWWIAVDIGVRMASLIGTARGANEAIDFLDGLRRQVPEDAADFAPLLVELGTWRLKAGETRAGRDLLLRAARLAAAERQPGTVAQAHQRLGNHDEDHGLYRKAIRRYQTALRALESQIGEPDRVGVATIHDEIATCRRNLGELDDAIQGHRRALEVFEDQQKLMSEFTCLTNLAKALHARGDDEEATSRLVRAVDLAEAFGWTEDALALCEQAATWAPDLSVVEQLWRRVLDLHAIVDGAGAILTRSGWLAFITT